MSWNFGGLALEKDFVVSVKTMTDLLNELGVYRIITDNEYDFFKATTRANNGMAAGEVNGHSLLIDHMLPYDCSFKEGEESALDKALAGFSRSCTALVFFLDGISGTCGFAFFKGGERVRRWAAEPGNILCSEGDYLLPEAAFIAGNATGIENNSSENEARVIAVLEDFLRVKLNDLVNDKTNMYQYFR